MRKKQTQGEGATPPEQSKAPRVRRATAQMAASSSSDATTEPGTNPPATAAGAPPVSPRTKRAYRRKSPTTQPVETSGADLNVARSPRPPRATVKKTPSDQVPKLSIPGTPASAPTKPVAPAGEQMKKMIAEKRETPVDMPVPKSVREPAQPVAARPAASGPAAVSGKPASVARPEKEQPKPKFELPKILFEGDETSVPVTTSGPGHKYAVGPAPAASKQPQKMQTLPQRLGSGNLTLTARDPHSLFAHWDLSIEQQRGYLADAGARHLSIRLRAQDAGGAVLSETAVLAETRHWFLHAPQAGTRYAAELGYYVTAGEWISVAISGPATTPPETFSQDRTVRFAQMPPPSYTVSEALPEVGRRHQEEPRPERPPEAGQAQWTAPARSYEPVAPTGGLIINPQTQWTPAQERALEEIVTAMVVRQEWFDSFQLVEMIEQRRGGRERIPGAPAKLPLSVEIPGPSSLELLGAELGPESISSPFGVEEHKPRRDFWFNVNAELIIYGATEPTARVTIGGRQIKLRPDGTFSYRFALPDGQFDLPAEALSVDDDRRRAELRFSRKTAYQGEVGAHPQDRRLKVPAAENVA